MTRLFSSAYALFVVGGVAFGSIGLHNLEMLAQRQDASVSVSPAQPEPTAIVTRFQTPLPAIHAPVAPIALTPEVSAVDQGPDWWLLYVVGGDLWETNGSASMQLTQLSQITQPALGENALSFVQREHNASDLWLASADGPPQPITRDASPVIAQNHWVSQPVLLPGGERAYVLGDFNKNNTAVGDLAVWELTLSNGGVVQITHPPAYTGGDQDVTLNPHDPSKIVFTRYAYLGTDLVEQLQWLDVSGHTTVPLTPPDRPSQQASFSPDGTELAFVQRSPGGAEDLSIADLQVDGTHAQLTNLRLVASGVIANPVWSPDASSLAYITLNNDQFQLWTSSIQRDADGTETFGPGRQVTHGPSIEATSRPVFMTPQQAEAIRHWLQP